jgi:RimJ/RimL family protein N-acetyltransferase
MLATGSEIVVRPIREKDAAGLARAHARLSPRSRQMRFLNPMPKLSSAQLRYLTEVDHRDHEAVVAIERGSRAIVGVARYVRLQHRPDVAELAAVVIDEWQGRGVGRTLVHALVDRARENGVERFSALVSSENDPVNGWLKGVGATAHRDLFELDYEFPIALLARSRVPALRRSSSRSPLQSGIEALQRRLRRALKPVRNPS